MAPATPTPPRPSAPLPPVAACYAPGSAQPPAPCTCRPRTRWQRRQRCRRRPYIDWFNFRRLHGEIGLIPPVEHERLHRRTTPTQRPGEREFHASVKPGV